MNKNLLYKMIIQEGCDVTYKRLLLCCLNTHYHFLRKTLYQVDCDDAKFRFNQNYTDLDDAVAKFVELKKKVYKK